MLLRTLVVDDETLARERLHRLLEAEPGVRVVGHCANGQEALAFVRANPIDLVLLDVQMPEMDGFAFIKALPNAPLPPIIITTAYSQYAAQAFETPVVDYLLKPINQERLRQALRRAEVRLESLQAVRLIDRLARVRGHLQRRATTLDRMPVKADGRITFINLDDVDWIQAADNYCALHVGTSQHLLLSSLKALEGRLPHHFIRISRSAIVNLNRVSEIEYHRRGNGTIILRQGGRLPFSRAHRRRLDEWADSGGENRWRERPAPGI